MTEHDENAVTTDPAAPSDDTATLLARIAELEASVAAKAAPAKAEPEGPPEPSAAQAALTAGDLITRTSFDPYSGAGGENVTLYGFVVSVEDDDFTDAQGNVTTTRGAVVAWLRDLSHPIALTELDPVNDKE